MLHSPVWAQGGPNGVPPDSFTGKQYVDLDGCIYIRAGTANATRWVPRVTRDRRQLCGFEPSVPAGVTMPVQAGAQVEIITVTDSAVVPGVPNDRVSAGKVPASPAPVPRTAEERFLPDHLVAERVQSRAVRLPEGYRPAWNDDRLNLRRAEQTRTGTGQSQAIWTNTVPRRLR